jgi:hypothetical protein
LTFSSVDQTQKWYFSADQRIKYTIKKSVQEFMLKTICSVDQISIQKHISWVRKKNVTTNKNVKTMIFDLVDLTKQNDKNYVQDFL